MKKKTRRQVRKRRGSYEKSKMKFVLVLAIMFIAVALGYVTARFVIGPILGYNADESPLVVFEEESQAEEESENEEKTETEAGGYALQFGVFSTKDAAQKLVDSLNTKGVKAQILEEDGLFKVISPIIQTKDEALDKLNEINDKEVEDVFIASF